MPGPGLGLVSEQAERLPRGRGHLDSPGDTGQWLCTPASPTSHHSPLPSPEPCPHLLLERGFSSSSPLPTPTSHGLLLPAPHVEGLQGREGAGHCLCQVRSDPEPQTLWDVAPIALPSARWRKARILRKT